MKRNNFYKRILKVEPGVSLAQWIYDTVAGNWPRLSAAFIAGGGLTYLSTITAWASQLGPAGVGAIGLSGFLISYLMLTAAQSQRAKARVLNSEAQAIVEWSKSPHLVNPLDSHFHQKRIRISDIAHPISGRITNKSFTDCQLIGPAIITFSGGGTATGISFGDCDVVAIKNNVKIKNVYVFENCHIVGGEIINSTLYVPPSMINDVESIHGINFITTVPR